MSLSVPSRGPRATTTATLPRYGQLLQAVRESLRRRVMEGSAGESLAEYLVRGKMLRAYLVFASAEAVRGSAAACCVGAEAIELLHAASLIHDDIIDQAAHRRGVASVHEQIGTGRALVVGDELLFQAFSTLSEATSTHPSATVLRALTVMNAQALECCRGQHRELQADSRIDEERYLEIVRGKTAAPFVAAAAVGALLGGGHEDQLSLLTAFARDLGVAFQIRDDLLDLTGFENALGKPVGNSVARGRPMLPLIYLQSVAGHSSADGSEAHDARPATLDGLYSLLDRHGLVERTREVQRRYLRSALDRLDTALLDPRGVDALRAMANRCSPE